MLCECLYLWLKTAYSVVIFVGKLSDTEMFIEVKSGKSAGQSWIEAFMNFDKYSQIYFFK